MLLEYLLPCFAYEQPTVEFALSAECASTDAACSGALAVALSSKVPQEDCGRKRSPPPTPPPSGPGSDYVLVDGPSPPFAPLAARSWNGTARSTGRRYTAYAVTQEDYSLFSFQLPPNGCSKHTAPSKSAPLFGCTYATNAGFFAFDPPACVGDTVLDGKIVQWQAPQAALFGVTQDGQAVLGYISSALQLPLRSAVSGRGWLVRDGVSFVARSREFPDPSASFVTEKAPRTAIGLLYSGAVVLVVVDGCEATDEGVDLNELAELLVDELGVAHAVNLDGGGSTVMVRGGEWWSRPTCNDVPALCERAVTTIACMQAARADGRAAA